MSDVVVRFVPKTKSAAPRLSFGLEAVSASPAAFSPDPRRARTALSFFAGRRGAEVKATEGNRIEVSMTSNNFNQIFGVGLAPGKYSDVERRQKQQESFVVPETMLTVPDELKDTIEFAYVPRPVEFYAPTYRPPSISLAHLRLADVRAALNAGRAHRQGWTGSGVRVAMVDSGFFSHPFFGANGYKLIPVGSPGSGDPQTDKSGHGTGESTNIFTIAPDCTVHGVKSGPSAASSLEAAIALNPDVMSNSWGFDVDHQTRTQLEQRDPNFFNELVDIETILTDAVQSGIVVLFSGGNGHRAFPACMPQIIAAGGVTVLDDASLEASSYASSFKSKLYPGRSVPDLCGVVGQAGSRPLKHHIMLPVPPGSELDGENLPPTLNGLGWGVFSGTSAACPQLAGAVALMRGIRNKLRADEARTALMKTAVDIEAGVTAMQDRAAIGPDLATGAGLANVRTACEFVAGIA